MPLSEFYRSVNGKNEAPQKKSTDISYIPNDEFVELVWEKGQIMMQGQSSKAKKTPVSSNFHFHTPKVQKKDAILDVPGMGLNQDDDMVPWLNYPLDDYCSDLLPEISSVTVNDPPLHNGLNVIDKSRSFNQSNKDPHSLTHNTRSSHLFSWPLNQVHNPDPMARSGVSEIGSSNNGRSKPHNVIHRDPVQIQGSSGNLEKMVQKQDSLRPYSSSTLLNFSHFSRPAAMAKANLENNEHPSLDSVRVGSNPFASKPLDEPHCVEKSTAVNGQSSNVVLDVNSAATAKGGPQTVKSNDPVGASSSVCSGNSAERASNSKRKSNDMEDFECESQDVEDESLGTKTTGGSRAGTGSKRSRAAEVHNLSERRRRDRINEKMFALQELIPNCNKVDKASMLDEAIEYLKTLQLQVQIMSMGTGLCMPPMIFPAGMQHLHPHFSPMGIGMGMNYGMGMGMGMEMEMNRGPPTMFPFRPPPPPITTTTQGSRHPPPVYGHPSQGMPMLFPQSPSIGIPINPVVQHIGAPSSVDPLQNKNPHVRTQICTQTQVGNNSLNQSTSVDKKDHRGLEVESSTAGVD